MPDIDTFRAETRSWLEANCPATMRTSLLEDEIVWGGRRETFENPEARIWLQRMVERGWTVPTWPREYGGGGLTAEEARVLNQELTRIHARPVLYSFGIWMLGPVLLEYANEEQKREYLPRIARGEIRWCQGYSEPGAGSDLASLQTRAEDKGDHYLVNGQKVWTSYADKADWIFCLVRTDPSKKHEGISFLLIDMASPGVEARPIRLISGHSPFCETFLTDVKVPKSQLVGKLHGGWQIAKRLLQFERQNISSSGFGRHTNIPVNRMAKEHGRVVNGMLADPDLRARIAVHKMDEQAFSLTVARLEQEAKAGHNIGPTTSILKYAAAKLGQERGELAVEALGLDGLGWEGEGFTPEELTQTRGWLRSKGFSIEGGTSEINLNVISKRVLGLPDA